jgi:hypothetical protein
MSWAKRGPFEPIIAELLDKLTIESTDSVAIKATQASFLSEAFEKMLPVLEARVQALQEAAAVAKAQADLQAKRLRESRNAKRSLPSSQVEVAQPGSSARPEALSMEPPSKTRVPPRLGSFTSRSSNDCLHGNDGSITVGIGSSARNRGPLELLRAASMRTTGSTAVESSLDQHQHDQDMQLSPRFREETPHDQTSTAPPTVPTGPSESYKAWADPHEHDVHFPALSSEEAPEHQTTLADASVDDSFRWSEFILDP